MALVDEAFASYLEGLIPPRPPILQEMEAYARRLEGASGDSSERGQLPCALHVARATDRNNRAMRVVQLAVR